MVHIDFLFTCLVLHCLLDFCSHSIKQVTLMTSNLLYYCIAMFQPSTEYIIVSLPWIWGNLKHVYQSQLGSFFHHSHVYFPQNVLPRSAKQTSTTIIG